MFTSNVLGSVLNAIDCAPWGAASGRHVKTSRQAAVTRRPLYTAEQRVRRDSTKWTMIQGVLAPIQFLVFLISLAMVARYLLTGDGLAVAEFSIVVKTLVLYTIMVTGAIWEREVFGRYLFAPAFYWEDMVSMLVLALHTGYLVALYRDSLSPDALMVLALAAYGSYVVNAMQFIMKLRTARLDKAGWAQPKGGAMGAA